MLLCVNVFIGLLIFHVNFLVPSLSYIVLRHLLFIVYCLRSDLGYDLIA